MIYQDGYVFGANASTYSECMQRMLFGNAMSQWHMISKIQVGRTALFIFNYTTRKLQGLFVAELPPGLNIEPSAWTSSGPRRGRSGGPVHPSSPFPAQVRVREVAKLAALDEATYRSVLTDGSDKNFGVYLTSQQAMELIHLMVSLINR